MNPGAGGGPAVSVGQMMGMAQQQRPPVPVTSAISASMQNPQHQALTTQIAQLQKQCVESEQNLKGQRQVLNNQIEVR